MNCYYILRVDELYFVKCSWSFCIVSSLALTADPDRARPFGSIWMARLFALLLYFTGDIRAKIIRVDF